MNLEKIEKEIEVAIKKANPEQVDQLNYK